MRLGKLHRNQKSGPRPVRVLRFPGPVLRRRLRIRRKPAARAVPRHRGRRAWAWLCARHYRHGAQAGAQLFQQLSLAAVLHNLGWVLGEIPGQRQRNQSLPAAEIITKTKQPVGSLPPKQATGQHRPAARSALGRRRCTSTCSAAIHCLRTGLGTFERRLMVQLQKTP